MSLSSACITFSERGGVDLHPTAEEIVGVEVTEHNVRVGNRRLFPPACNRRDRGRRRARGTDVDQLTGVEPGDTAPSGPTLLTSAFIMASTSSAKCGLTGKTDLSVRRNAHVKARPSHIAGDNLPCLVPFQDAYISPALGAMVGPESTV